MKISKKLTCIVASAFIVANIAFPAGFYSNVNNSVEVYAAQIVQKTTVKLR